MCLCLLLFFFLKHFSTCFYYSFKDKSEMSVNFSLKQKSYFFVKKIALVYYLKNFRISIQDLFVFYGLFPHDLNLTPIWLRPLTTKRLYEWNPYVWFTGPIITIAFIKVLQKPCLKCPSKCVWVEFDCLDNLLISSILFKSAALLQRLFHRNLHRWDGIKTDFNELTFKWEEVVGRVPL